MTFHSDGELQEVVAVASYQHAIVDDGNLENGRIPALRRKHISQPYEFVIEFQQQVREIVGDVVVEQELHR